MYSCSASRHFGMTKPVAFFSACVDNTEYNGRSAFVGNASEAHGSMGVFDPASLRMASANS